MADMMFRQVTITLGFWEDYAGFKVTDEEWATFVQDTLRNMARGSSRPSGGQFSVKSELQGPWNVGEWMHPVELIESYTLPDGSVQQEVADVEWVDDARG